jgi:hypothetical protein
LFYLLQSAGAVVYCVLNLERIEMKRYFVHIPSWIHIAMTCYGYDKKDAIARFRRQHGFVRMPKGFGIWEAS